MIRKILSLQSVQYAQTRIAPNNQEGKAGQTFFLLCNEDIGSERNGCVALIALADKSLKEFGHLQMFFDLYSRVLSGESNCAAPTRNVGSVDVKDLCLGEDEFISDRCCAQFVKENDEPFVLLPTISLGQE